MRKRIKSAISLVLISLLALMNFNLAAFACVPAQKGNLPNGKSYGKWELVTAESAKAFKRSTNNGMLVHIDNPGEARWDIALRSTIPSLEVGSTYKFEFEAVSKKDTSIYPIIRYSKEPFDEIWNNQWNPLTLKAGVKQSVSQTFTVNKLPQDEEIVFHMGGDLSGNVPNDIQYSNINLVKITSPNEILKYDFNDGKIGKWNLSLGNNAKAKAAVIGKELSVLIQSKGTDKWDINLKHPITALQKGAAYNVNFKVKSVKDTKIYAKIGYSGEPFNELWNNNWSPIGLKAGVPVSISQTFVANSEPQAEEIAFHMGGDLSGNLPNIICFDDIAISKITNFATPTPIVITPVPETPVPATPVPATPASTSLINDHFNDGDVDSWTLSTNDPAVASASVVNGEKKIHIDNNGNARWDIALSHPLPQLALNKTYKVEFKVRSLKDASIFAKIGDSADPFYEIWNNAYAPIELPAGNEVSVSKTFVIQNESQQAQEFVFHMGGDLAKELPNDIYIDDIVLSKIDDTTPATPTPVPATPVPSTPAADLVNDHFNDGDVDNWTLSTNDPAIASASVVNGEKKIHIDNSGEIIWDIALSHELPQMITGATYKVEFKVRSLKDASIFAKIGDSGNPFYEEWNNNWANIVLPAGEEVSVSQTFINQNSSQQGQVFIFDMGGKLANQLPNDIYIDDIVLSKIDDTTPATPTPVPVTPVPHNPLGSIINDHFNEGDVDAWALTVSNPAVANASNENGEKKVHITNNGNNNWDIALSHPLPKPVLGVRYKVEFKVRSTKNASIYAKIGDSGDPFYEVWNNNWTPIQLSAGKEVSVSQIFVFKNDSTQKQEFAFHLGGNLAQELPNDIYIDDITLTQLDFYN